MKDNKYETKHDYETELTELMEQKIHELGLCVGAPSCPYCLDEQKSIRGDRWQAS